MWGSISTNTSEPACTFCPHADQCRRAVHLCAPVLCEQPLAPGAKQHRPHAPKHWTQRNYAAFLQPGETFTAAELARRVGVIPHSAATWCSDPRRMHGDVEVVGHIHTDPQHSSKLYRYKPTKETTP
jgi:hypothetical protein